jgi:hypothetical protein
MPLSGVDYPLTVAATTSYTITAYNSKRKPPEAVAQTTVNVLPARIDSFKSNPNSAVDAGTPVILSWKTDFAYTVALDPVDDLDPPVSTHPLLPIDSRTVRPKQNMTYTLTATGLKDPVKAHLPVAVKSVEIVSFTVTPNETYPGGKVTLKWQVKNTNAIWIKAGSLGWSTKEEKVDHSYFNEESEIYDNPSNDTTYTLKCVGPNGPVEQYVIVKIIQ